MYMIFIYYLLWARIYGNHELLFNFFSLLIDISFLSFVFPPLCSLSPLYYFTLIYVCFTYILSVFWIFSSKYFHCFVCYLEFSMHIFVFQKIINIMRYFQLFLNFLNPHFPNFNFDFSLHLSTSLLFFHFYSNWIFLLKTYFNLIFVCTTRLSLSIYISIYPSFYLYSFQRLLAFFLNLVQIKFSENFENLV